MAVTVYGSADTQEKKTEPGIYGTWLGGMVGDKGDRTNIDKYITSNPETYFTPAQTAGAIYRQYASDLGDGGVNGGSGSGSGSGRKLSSADVAYAELLYKKQQDAEAKRIADLKLNAMKARVAGGDYMTPYNNMIAGIEELGRGREKNARENFAALLGNIDEGYGEAQRLTEEGYGRLQDYLAQNPNNPYANLSVSMPQATNPMQSYLEAYGAMGSDVQGQLQAQQNAAQYGAENFKNLIQVLSSQADLGNQSRMSEMQMALNLANTGLAQQKAQYKSRGESELANALFQIQQDTAKSRLEQEMAAAQYKDALLNAIMEAGGGYVVGPEESGTELTPETRALLEARRSGF